MSHRAEEPSETRTGSATRSFDMPSPDPTPNPTIKINNSRHYNTVMKDPG
jgi:hypothetical protein